MTKAVLRPKSVQFKRYAEYALPDLIYATEIGETRLCRIRIALQQLLKDNLAQGMFEKLRAEVVGLLDFGSPLADMQAAVERNTHQSKVRFAAEVLGAQLQNSLCGD